MGRSNLMSERIGPELTVDEARLTRPHPAVDPDAVLVERLRRRDAGAAEALVASYGDPHHGQPLGCRGGRTGRPLGRHPQDRWLPRDGHLRNLGLPNHANAAYQKRQGRLVERNATPWEDLAPSFDRTGQHVQPGLDWSPRLKDPALQAELQSMLRAAIEELSEDHRAPFRLHDVEGLSNPEIAEVLQTKPATVKARVHRARLFLRSRLADYVGVGTELN